MFANFKQTFGKEYTSDHHEELSFNHFVYNLKVIDEMNALAVHEDDAKFGVTHFADLNSTGLIGIPAADHEHFVPSAGDNVDVHGRKLPGCDTAYNTNFNRDWSAGAGKITSAVKDFGQCYYGHWAFAVVSQVESDAKRRSGAPDYVLSPQQLLHCVTSNSGCSAASLGVAEAAFTYLKTKGSHSNNNYPFTSSNGVTGGPCVNNYNNEEVRVAGFFSTLTGNEACMTKYVQDTGTLAACFTIAENAWLYYSGGIMSSSQCSTAGGYQRVVCAQIVGIRIVPGSTDYWKVRGSFSTSWGEAGYIRLSWGYNTCNLNQDPLYTTVLLQGEF